MFFSSRRISSLIVGIALAVGSSFAEAQDFPTRPIRLIVGASPGVGTDIPARLLAREMSKILGQPIVVENKPGAAHLIAYQYVAKQVPADGYTIAFVDIPSLVLLPLMVKNLRFDPLMDLPPFIRVSENRLVLLSSSKLPWKTFNELVRYAKANPGKLNYGSSVAVVRLPMVSLMREIGLDAVHIPYASSGEYLRALASGEVQMGFAGVIDATPGELRPLAITGNRRLAALPDVPTFAELGHPNILGTSYSLNAPIGTPAIALNKLRNAASRVLQQQNVKAAFAAYGREIVNEEPPEAALKSMAALAKVYAEAAKAAGIQPE